MQNVVIRPNKCDMFHNDRLRNDRALGNRKSDNNVTTPRTRTTLMALEDPSPGLKTHSVNATHIIMMTFGDPKRSFEVICDITICSISRQTCKFAKRLELLSRRIENHTRRHRSSTVSTANLEGRFKVISTKSQWEIKAIVAQTNKQTYM